MESRKTESTPAQSSITAPAVLSGFRRALLAGYKDLFTDLDLKLATHFFLAAKAAYPHFTKNRALLEGISMLPYQTQSNLFDKKILKAYDHLILLRKLMIKQVIERAIGDGYSQIVILGGGYDVRALVAGTEHEAVTFFEIDRGETRQTKVNALYSMGSLGDSNHNFSLKTMANGTVIINKNIYFIEADLAIKPLKTCLLENGFNVAQKTLVIAEGLLAYLSIEQTHALVKSIHDLCEHDQIQALLGTINKFAYTDTIKKVQGASNELWSSCLAPEEAIRFFADDQMTLIGKFEPARKLYLLEDFINQTYYESSDKEIREMYYLMEKGLSQHQIIHLDAIPDIAVTGQAPAHKECTPSCTLL